MRIDGWHARFRSFSIPKPSEVVNAVHVTKLQTDCHVSVHVDVRCLGNIADLVHNVGLPWLGIILAVSDIFD